MIRSLSFLFVFSMMLISAAPASANEDLDTLVKWMEGSFSSLEHSKRDTAYQHVDLHLRRIWHDHPDGVWFYVEQAMAATPEAPYRQRIYQVRAIEEGMFETAIYLLPKPDSVIGAWRDPALLKGLQVSQLTKRFGCEVYLQYTGDKFFGSTHGMACKGSSTEAAYIRTDVEIRWYGMMSWDRGFNTTGEQVWGSTNGGYVFLRALDEE